MHGECYQVRVAVEAKKRGRGFREGIVVFTEIDRTDKAKRCFAIILR